MNLAAERRAFEIIVARVPGAAVQQALLREFDRLKGEYEASTDDAKKNEIAGKIALLRQEAAEAAGERGDWSGRFYSFISVLALAFFASVVAYFWAIGPDSFDDIAATRPILVFTLIVSMLGFGGALIFRSLFTTEPAEAFERRFRLGREIFLVYSGIFGTIIGFYFGAADRESDDTAPVLAAPSVTQTGLVSTVVTGGTAPFSGTIRLGAEDRSVFSVGNAVWIQLDRARDCPAGAKISVRDSRQRNVETTIGQKASALVTAGWPGCVDEAAAEAAADGNTQANAADNAQGNAGDANTSTAPTSPN